MIFSFSHTAEVLTGESDPPDHPIVFTNSMGLIWVADCARNNQETTIHLIGPAFFDDVSHQTLYESMQRLKLSPQSAA